MNIAMVTAEALPFSKTGGLGDVAYALSKEFVKKGHNVSIFVPFYRNFNYKKYIKLKHVISVDVKMNWRNLRAEVFHISYDKIDYYFIQNGGYFERDNYYGYFDDGERFAFFQLAVLELIKRLPIKYDILHVHDWQAAMIPCLIKKRFNYDPILKDLKTVLTIHNPLFKGYFNKESLYDLYELDYYLYQNGSLRLEEQVSTLKAGIYYSDKITTVSPTHKEELKTFEGSKGLNYDLVLREYDFEGILNGMDYDEFNPRKDPTIYANYTLKTLKEGKMANKIAFANEHHLDPNKPMYAVVSRLTSQKGLELINAMAEYLVNEGATFCVLGSGEKEAEEYYNNLYRRFPNNVFVYIGYNNDIAHKLYASSDFFIMPSQFEPCGLGQMIAQRYGSLPIVRRTGGLKDSVIPYSLIDNNIKNADGFGFDSFNSVEAVKCVAETLLIYQSKQDIFAKLRKNAFKVDHKWSSSADKYLELYSKILN